MKAVVWIPQSLIVALSLASQVAMASDVSVTAFDLAPPVQTSSLEQSRGGFDMVVNDTQLSGIVNNNVASHIRSGANTISEGAFANASGLPVVIQNSGSNVLIQNATVVNVQFQ